MALPPVAYGGIVGFLFLLATLYTGYAKKDIKIHRTLAVITFLIALAHGIYAIMLFIQVTRMDKKFWRCTVCNDIHFGVAGPEICPTCQQKNVYVESDIKEAKNVMQIG